MIKGAIFDMDGTVLDSIPAWGKVPEMFLGSIGVRAEAGLEKVLFSMSMAETAVFIKNRYGLDLDEEEIITGFNRTIENFYFYQVRLKKGAEQLLKDMKQAGIKLVAATATDRYLVEGALKRLDVLRHFDRLFTCTEIGAGKTRPDIYLAASGYMGTLPEDTWVFEDALYAIRTAKKAGFRTIGVYDASSMEIE